MSEKEPGSGESPEEQARIVEEALREAEAVEQAEDITRDPEGKEKNAKLRKILRRANEKPKDDE